MIILGLASCNEQAIGPPKYTTYTLLVYYTNLDVVDTITLKDESSCNPPSLNTTDGIPAIYYAGDYRAFNVRRFTIIKEETK